MTQIAGLQHPHQSSWWRGATIWWLVGLALILAMLAVVVFEKAEKLELTPYSTFFDQLEAGNIASVTFQGTDINGTFKHPVNATPASTAAARDTFRSRVPDFGDSGLMLELRKQHVVINVGSPSQWTRLLASLPWPMLLFVGAALIAGLIRLLRGGRAQSGSTMATSPMQGMIGFVSGLFGKPKAADPSTHDGGGPKTS
jgi:ATP-dependent Zn protease